MRLLKLFGCVMVVATLSACGGVRELFVTPPPPPEHAQLALLGELGVDAKSVTLIEGARHFPLGSCSGVLSYSGYGGDTPVLKVYSASSTPYPIEEFSGRDEVLTAGKTAKTMFCLQGAQATQSSVPSTKADAGESK